MKRIHFLITCVCLISTNALSQADSIRVEPENLGRIFLSRDQGENWIRSDAGFPKEGSVNALALIDKTVVAATEEHGIYISENGLKSWKASNKGLSLNEKVNTLITHNGLLFAGTFSHGVFVSDNHGASWKPASEGLVELSLTIRSFYSFGRTLIVGTGSGIYTSDDNGKTWTLAIHGTQINTFATMGSFLFAATSHGILRSENGRTWTWVWRKDAVTAIASDNQNLVALAGDQYVQYGTNQGQNWVRIEQVFDRYTFRLTPNSGKLLIPSWKKTFKALKEVTPFKPSGLPEKTPFSNVLDTPFGVITAVGFDGC